MEDIVWRKERKRTQEFREVRSSPSFAFCVSLGCDPIRAISAIRGGMLIFMEHIDCAKRLLYKGGPPVVTAARESRQQRIAPIPRMKWGFCGFLCGESQFWSAKCRAREAGGTRSTSSFTLETSRSAEGDLRKRKPNLGGLGCVDKGGCRVGGSAWKRNVQNEPNSRGRDGDSASAGIQGERLAASLQTGAECAKQSQLAGADASDKCF